MWDFAWDGSASVGHPEIDKQHAKLAELADTLARAVDAGGRREAVMRCLSDLYLYANAHFREEEALLKSLGRPDMERHIAMHREFVVKVDKLVDCCLNENTPYDALMDLLHTWYTEHVLVEDVLALRQGQPEG